MGSDAGMDPVVLCDDKNEPLERLAIHQISAVGCPATTVSLHMVLNTTRLCQPRHRFEINSRLPARHPAAKSHLVAHTRREAQASGLVHTRRKAAEARPIP